MTWLTVDLHEAPAVRPVAVLRLNRPPVNALNGDLKDELMRAARDLAADMS